jgi:hypothetical protein
LEELELIYQSGYCADHPWFQPDIIDDHYDDDDDDDDEFVFEYEPLQLKQARRAAAHGIAVLPCDPATNRPLVPLDQASTDIATITQWWMQFPDAMACAAIVEPAESPRSRAKLSYYDELDDPAPKRWIMKGVLAHGETSNWFGPPGSLKSALMTDLAIHVASMRDWRGYRAKTPWCGVLYLALERGAQVKRRLQNAARLPASGHARSGRRPETTRSGSNRRCAVFS